MGPKIGRLVHANIPNLFINILASRGHRIYKLLIFCKILAYRGFEAFLRNFGSLNSSYLVNFHEYKGILFKSLVFMNIMA
jgi:hypothetical protein